MFERFSVGAVRVQRGRRFVVLLLRVAALVEFLQP